MHTTQKLKHYFIPYLLLLPFAGLTAQSPGNEPINPLSLQDVLDRTLLAHPRLQTQAQLAEVADGRSTQAAARPNPVVGLEAENFLGTGAASGVESVEITLGVSQVFETGDKREKRQALARVERRMVDWEHASLRMGIEAAVKEAFTNTLLAQKSLELQKEQVALAQENAKVTSRLVDAALSSEVELKRAELAVRQQQFRLQKSQRALASSKAGLASLWGEPGRTDYTLAGDISLDPEIPAFKTLASELPQTVAFTRFMVEEKRLQAALELEEAMASPDLEVFAGGKYINEEDGDFGFVAGIELPWPLYHKNEGNIRAAQARLQAVTHEREAILRDHLAILNELYQELLSAREEASLIEKELLPAAEATVQATEKGYAQGQFTQLTVIESLGTLFEIREAHLEALKRYATAQTAIETLTRTSNF